MYYQDNSVNENECFFEVKDSIPLLQIPTIINHSSGEQQQERQMSELNSLNVKNNKTRTIQKQHKPSRKRSKKGKQTSKNNITGRPVNLDIENLHLKESKSFNDIIYHYSRILIFIRLREDKKFNSFTLHLSNQESQWISQTQSIMSIENFPDYNNRNIPFLLHPASLHFVFQHRKKVQKKQSYGSQEIKFMLIAFLKKKNLLNQSIFDYISQYWEDIIELVNSNYGESNVNIQSTPQRLEFEGKEPFNSLESPENIKQSRHSSQAQHSNSIGNQGKKQKKLSQLEQLKLEIREDQSILAYQIACYLHSCCQKFWFNIMNMK